MRSTVCKQLLFLIAVSSVTIRAQEIRAQDFEHYFGKGSMQADFIIAGDSEHSEIYLDRVSKRKYWAGTRKNLIDPFGYGKYKYELADPESGQPVFSRGFSTLFEEWQTTPEAERVARSFQVSVVFPCPARRVRLKLFERNDSGKHILRLETLIDPHNYLIHNEKAYDFKVKKLVSNGAPEKKVDLVFLAEGYTKKEMKKFRADAERFAGFLFEAEPFKSMQEHFNIWAVESVSRETGTDIPGEHIFRSTVLNTSFYTFDSERYLTTRDHKKVMDIAALAPCDHVCILVNSDKYGGGGFYNHYSVTTTGHSLSDKLLLHELGHGLGGLGDEYYTSSVAYDDPMYKKGVEPWEPNLTTLTEFEKKWKDMLETGIPVPTPDIPEYAGKTGVFKGGGYLAKGVYRPATDCRMKSNEAEEYCAVCRRALERMILYFTR